MIGVAGVTLAGAAVLVWSEPGVCWLIVALCVAALAVITRRANRSDRDTVGRLERLERIGWAAGALALVAIGTIRADSGLLTWCVFAALACGSVALAGGRSVAGIGMGAIAFVVASGRGIAWWRRGARQVRRSGSNRVRIGRTVAVSVLLVLVFGLLFASADRTFAHVVGYAIPSFSGASVGRVILALIIVMPVALGFGYLAGGEPAFDALPEGRSKTVRRIEWASPLAILDVLFAIFVAVQLDFLFGGRERVLRTSGLTYAQYARSGFWQLLIVVALTVIVIGVAVRVAPRTHRADRVLCRVLLGGLCLLTLVIVASALNRLRVYDDAYGFTRERLAVGVIEAWLGIVFVLIICAGVALRGRWVPRTAAAMAVIALLTTALANPDGFIASRDVDRYQRTGRIDVSYLSGLSADAVPALQRLPPSLRGCVLSSITDELSRPEDWRSWNLDRQRARRALRGGAGSCGG
ncbi:MAG TPA: DUF4173 domain-containing protein [Micromonosporaceae bacterium]|nr:DUF4173 domain-containing protein [Micromonosporaceae bacterium]